MSFDLRIHFVGLNLFVPEPGKKMHVLQPATQHHEEHYSRIIYDEEYTKPGATQLTRRFWHIETKGCELDFSGLSVAEQAIDTYIPPEIVSIGDFTHGVDRTLVSDGPATDFVTARVSMDSGALTFCGLGAAFKLDIGLSLPRKQRMAVRTEWTIRGITTTISGKEGLPGRTLRNGKKLPDLYPIGKTIHLLVFHAVAAEFAPHGEDFDIPKAAKDADHFNAYYTVSPRKNTNLSYIPTPGDPIPVDPTGDKVEKNSGETPGLTCLQGQSFLSDLALLRDHSHHLAAKRDDPPRQTIPFDQRVV